MPEFKCKVGSPSGEVREELHVAPDADTLTQELQRRDLHVFEVKPTGPGLSIGGMRLGGSAKRVPRRQFLLFNQEFVTLMRAGLPLLECLEVLLERMPEGPFRRYLTDIRERVQAGSSLSEAFMAQGEAFPKIYAASLTAGEKSGELPAVMLRYLKFTKRTEEIRSKVTAALIYPTLLSIMSVGLILFLIFYILPRFSEFYAEFEADLPTLTIGIMNVVGWLQARGLYILVGAIALYIGAKLWQRTDAGELTFDKIKLALPVLGGIQRMYHTAQFSRTLSTLLSGGIPLVSALDTTQGALTNRVFTDGIQAIGNDVREGQALWQSIESTAIMSDLTIEMVKVGEATGSLDSMLGEVASFYDDQLDESMTRFVSLFEPILLIFMGIIVTIVLLSMYLPIFQLAGSTG